MKAFTFTESRNREKFLSINNLVAVLFMAAVLAFACSPGEAEKSSVAHGDLLDVTQEAGIDFVHDAGENGSYFIPEQVGSGCAFFDYDNDGLQDIYLINARTHDASQPPGAWSQNQLYRQRQGGTFVNVTEESGLGDTGFGMGVAVGDLDNDGDLDVYVTNYGADQLYQNQGNGTFLNVTKAAGIKNERWGCSATFVDYDLDGYLDIFVANYLRIDPTITCTDRSGRPEYCGPEFQPAAADVLYKNNGDGTFTDVSFSSRIGLPERRGLGVVACDFNFDGYPDLYVANDGDENTLWTNRKDGTFIDHAMPLGVAVNRLGAREAGMGIAVGDVTGKLTPDIFVTHLDGESNTLYLNHGLLGFEDASAAAGFERMDMLSYTGFGVGLVDLNLDANLDLVIGNGRVKRRPGVYTQGDSFWQAYAEPNLIFEGLGGGKFQNASTYYPQFSGPVESSRGVAFADYDNDGDVDFLVTNCGGRARLYKNELARKGNWLSLTMFDPKLNRVVNGTRVILTAGNKKLAGEVMPGYSFLCSNDYRIHFGLGQLDAMDKATVHWLGGGVEEFTGIPINQHVKIEKGKGAAVAQ
jgi:hypothetical protein